MRLCGMLPALCLNRATGSPQGGRAPKCLWTLRTPAQNGFRPIRKPARVAACNPLHEVAVRPSRSIYGTPNSTSSYPPGAQDRGGGGPVQMRHTSRGSARDADVREPMDTPPTCTPGRCGQRSSHSLKHFERRSDALAQNGSGRIRSNCAHKVAHGSVHSVQAGGNERQQCGRAGEMSFRWRRSFPW